MSVKWTRRTSRSLVSDTCTCTSEYFASLQMMDPQFTGICTVVDFWPWCVIQVLKKFANHIHKVEKCFGICWWLPQGTLITKYAVYSAHLKHSCCKSLCPFHSKFQSNTNSYGNCWNWPYRIDMKNDFFPLSNDSAMCCINT